jgi:hypothetical protein
MGFSEMYIKFVDIYINLIDTMALKIRILAPFLYWAKLKLIESKVRT